MVLAVCGVAALAVDRTLRPHILTLGKGVFVVTFMTAWLMLLGWLFSSGLGLFGRGLDWIGPAAIWAIVGMVLLLMLWLRFFARRARF